MRRCKKVEKRETRGPRIFTRQKRAMFGKSVTVLFRPWEDKDQSPAEAAPFSLLTVPQTRRSISPLSISTTSTVLLTKIPILDDTGVQS